MAETDSIPAIIARKRKEAVSRGDLYYFTGKPCKHGHIAKRYTSIGRCLQCHSEYVVDNRDHLNELVRKRRRDDPARRREARKRENPEKRRASQKRYGKAHPEYKRSSNNNRRARKKNNGGRFSREDILVIRKWQRGKCAYCKRKLGAKYHIDHIVALSNGGSNWPSNLQLTCSSCNLCKQDSDPIEFAQSRGLLL